MKRFWIGAVWLWCFCVAAQINPAGATQDWKGVTHCTGVSSSAVAEPSFVGPTQNTTNPVSNVTQPTGLNPDIGRGNGGFNSSKSWVLSSGSNDTVIPAQGVVPEPMPLVLGLSAVALVALWKWRVDS